MVAAWTTREARSPGVEHLGAETLLRAVLILSIAVDLPPPATSALFEPD
jgi:hypothetical protein